MANLRFSRDGGDHVLHAEQWLPAPLAQVFVFFSDALQLEALTPSTLRFHVLTPRPIVMQAGLLIDYALRIRGLPVRWQSEISVWEPPVRFVDRQTRGPYRLWVHEHSFAERDGGTLVSDHVRYRVPGGRLVNWLVVERDLRRIFSYRQQRLGEIFAKPQADPQTDV